MPAFSEMMKMAIRKNNNFLQVLSDILHEHFKRCKLLFPPHFLTMPE